MINYNFALCVDQDICDIINKEVDEYNIKYNKIEISCRENVYNADILYFIINIDNKNIWAKVSKNILFGQNMKGICNEFELEVKSALQRFRKEKLILELSGLR